MPASPATTFGPVNVNRLRGTEIISNEGDAFTLGDILGVGSSSVVYDAHPHQAKVPTRAAKVLQDEIQDVDVHKRFEREVRIGRSIDHPAILKVLDWGKMPKQLGQRVFILMDRLDGEVLQEYVDRAAGRPLPYAQVVGWLLELLDGLAVVHAQNIIHRDLKPDNVMLLRTGSVKLMDFGIARQADGYQTRNHQAMGTPQYMSPEHLNARNVTVRSDLYSIGAMAYHMLSGRTPLPSGVSLRATLMAISKGDFPTLASVNPSLPKGLTGWVDRMMARAPEDRYANAREAAQALVQATGAG
jgi:serine/threonine-protein kinase